MIPTRPHVQLDSRVSALARRLFLCTHCIPATLLHALRQACLYSLALLVAWLRTWSFLTGKMPRLAFLAGVLLVSLGLVPLMTTSRAADISASQSSMERRYSTPHSLGDSYQFHPRDGWESVNITNLQYKYSRSLADSLEAPDYSLEDLFDPMDGLNGPAIPRAHSKRASKKAAKSSAQKAAKKTASKVAKTSPKAAKTTSAAKSAANGLLGSVKSVVDSMKALGDPEPVTITWYTGHDLENPSCWSTTTWTPTVRFKSPSFVFMTHLCDQDESMVSAVTLEGWKNRPQCFKFVERQCPLWFSRRHLLTDHSLQLAPEMCLRAYRRHLRWLRSWLEARRSHQGRLFLSRRPR